LYAIMYSKIFTMVVISTAELRNNMKKYFDTAATETVVIQRGKKETFVLKRQDSFQEIPEDFFRAITGKEVMAGVEKGLREMIKRKDKQKAVV